MVAHLTQMDYGLCNVNVLREVRNGSSENNVIPPHDFVTLPNYLKLPVPLPSCCALTSIFSKSLLRAGVDLVFFKSLRARAACGWWLFFSQGRCWPLLYRGYVAVDVVTWTRHHRAALSGPTSPRPARGPMVMVKRCSPRTANLRSDPRHECFTSGALPFS